MYVGRATGKNMFSIVISGHILKKVSREQNFVIEWCNQTTRFRSNIQMHI